MTRRPERDGQKSISRKADDAGLDAVQHDHDRAANQAVRIPQELGFPADVKEVRIRKHGDGLFISPVKPDWPSFFAMQVDVPDDFLENRNDSSPQSRDPL